MIEKLIKEVGMQTILEELIEAAKKHEEDYCQQLAKDLKRAYDNYMKRYDDELPS